MAHKQETERQKRDGWRNLSVLLDRETFAALEDGAKGEQRPVSALARIILRRWAERRAPKTKAPA